MCQNIGIQDLLRKFGNDWKLDVEFRFFIIFENGSGLNGLITWLDGIVTKVDLCKKFNSFFNYFFDCDCFTMLDIANYDSTKRF